MILGILILSRWDGGMNEGWPCPGGRMGSDARAHARAQWSAVLGKSVADGQPAEQAVLV